MFERLLFSSTRLAVSAASLIALSACVSTEPTGSTTTSTLSLADIYQDQTFAVQSFPTSRWLADGSGYTTLEDGANQGVDIVRYRADGSDREVLVSAQQLTPDGRGEALQVADYQWSEDSHRILVFTNTRRSWRTHTLGDYWVLDRKTGHLVQVGADMPEAALQFAKFNPAGDRVAFVMQNNIYVQDLAGMQISQLTTDGDEYTINGTFDWVNEEEFGLQDGFRWSPDGQHIAYWQLDTEGVPMFKMIDNVSELYPTTTQFPYPKVGETNSALRIGVITASGGDTTWMNIPGEPRDHYLVRMEWAGNSEQLLVQQMNRAQNTMHLWATTRSDGEVTRLLTEQSEAWVEQVDDLQFFNDGQSFTWLSERNGYRQLYRVDRSNAGHNAEVTPLTYGEHQGYDIIDVKQIVINGESASDGWVYYVAAPDNPLQTALFRAALSGDRVERLTPTDWSGTHDYQISADGEYALHTFSTVGQAPQTRMVNLPEHEVISELEMNSELAQTLTERVTSETEFFRVTARDGLELDAYIMRPADFDPRQSYPLLMYVYGEPWGQTVADRWLGHSWLWHEYLTQQGYIVVSVDNRGTRSPRGQAWRHSIYKQLGVITVQDQADALDDMLSRWDYIDASRVAMWGHSGGGSQTLNALFRYPEKFHAGIALAPVPDLRLYDTIYQERYSGLLPEEAESYAYTSAVTHAEHLQGDLLLVHGTADDNVHYQGSERLIDELVKHQKQFRFMAYPNRTHGIAEGPGTSLHLRTMMTEFLHDSLKKRDSQQ